MLVSGPALSVTGGHCDNDHLPYEYHATDYGAADGVDIVQHKAREIIKYGADLTKVCATGGVLSKRDDPNASQYTLEEMKAIKRRLWLALRAEPQAGRFVTCSVRERKPHPIYARHNLSVPTFKLAALEEQGELGFSHLLLITQNKLILTDIPLLGTRKAERSAELVG